MKKMALSLMFFSTVCASCAAMTDATISKHDATEGYRWLVRCEKDLAELHRVTGDAIRHESLAPSRAVASYNRFGRNEMYLKGAIRTGIDAHGKAILHHLVAWNGSRADRAVTIGGLVATLRRFTRPLQTDGSAGEQEAYRNTMGRLHRAALPQALRMVRILRVAVRRSVPNPTTIEKEEGRPAGAYTGRSDPQLRCTAIWLVRARKDILRNDPRFPQCKTALRAALARPLSSLEAWWGKVAVANRYMAPTELMQTGKASHLEGISAVAFIDQMLDRLSVFVPEVPQVLAREGQGYAATRLASTTGGRLHGGHRFTLPK